MSKVDPTGFEAALATIPEGQLSERQHRIAAGIALINDEGLSTHEAARRVSIPQATLYRYHRGQVALNQEMPAERDLEAVTRASYDISQIAADAILDSLANEREDWKPGDLIKAYGVATDKVIAINRKAAPPDESAAAALVGVLAKAFEGKSVTVTEADPVEQAVEVEATSE